MPGRDLGPPLHRRRARFVSTFRRSILKKSALVAVFEQAVGIGLGPPEPRLQVRDLERSAAFYEQYLGLNRSDAGPPHAVVFGTKPIAFAVRNVVTGVDLDAIAQPGQGMALWLHAPDAQDIHDALAAAGTTIISAPVDGPFGRTFTFADPDGYQVTLHDRG